MQDDDVSFIIVSSAREVEGIVKRRVRSLIFHGSRLCPNRIIFFKNEIKMQHLHSNWDWEMESNHGDDQKD